MEVNWFRWALVHRATNELISVHKQRTDAFKEITPANKGQFDIVLVKLARATDA